MANGLRAKDSPWAAQGAGRNPEDRIAARPCIPDCSGNPFLPSAAKKIGAESPVFLR
jgi:hypothetical protein